MSLATRLAARRLHLRPADTHRVGIHRDLAIPTTNGETPLYADRYFPRDDSHAPLVITTTTRPAPSLIARLIAERGYQVLVITPDNGTKPARAPATLHWLQRQSWYPGTITTLSANTLLTHLQAR